jgi:predicted ABC-type ATPase
LASRIPLIVVIAGPNGAGKTTAAPALLREALAVNEFVNADTIAQGLSAFRSERAAVAAGRVMLARLHTLAQSRETFAFETTLGSRSFAPWLRARRAEGYRVHLAFLSLPTVELAIARVRERVRLGGHDVPEPVIRRRFVAGLRNFFTIYREIADAWQMFDNSDVGNPRLIASGHLDTTPAIIDENDWSTLMEQAR